MISCLRTRFRKQSIIALYFKSETVLKFYNLEASFSALCMSLEKVNILHTQYPFNRCPPQIAFHWPTFICYFDDDHLKSNICYTLGSAVVRY